MQLTKALPFLALLLTIPTVGQAQRRQGSYLGTSWTINDSHALVWGNAPYTPIGVRTDADPAIIEQAYSAGIKDVLVDLPASGAGWGDAFRTLEARGMRYVVRISSLAPRVNGYAVDPAAYRITGLNGPRKLDITLPDAESLLVVLVQKRDGAILKNYQIQGKSGRFAGVIDAAVGLDSIALLYPLRGSTRQMGYWETFDAHRDSVLAALRRNPPGKGFRGIVNPAGQSVKLLTNELRFVPSSPRFRLEFRNFLEERYKTVETAIRGWSMAGSPISTSIQLDGRLVREGRFEDLARLVPLWSGSRGIGQLWDPQTNRIYSCDNRRSAIWKDLFDAITSAEQRRLARFVTAVRSVVDVPVIQEWNGWAGMYESAEPALDGIGMTGTGPEPSLFLSTASRATSSVARWKSNGWLIGTSLFSGVDSPKAPMISAILDDALAIGAKGAFLSMDSPDGMKLVAAEAAKRAGEADLASSFPIPVFFPENATYPAVAQRLTNGQWWLPCPSDGNRVDLGGDYYAYRLKRESNSLVLWGRRSQRVLLRFVKPTGVTFKTLDGSDPLPKVTKTGIEIQLSEYPLQILGTDEVPVPQPAYDDLVGRFAQLLQFADKVKRDATSERVFFADAVKAFDRNPGGSFDLMHRQYNALASRIGDYTWIECESTRDHNFSEVIANPGCSGSAVLTLSSGLIPDERYEAKYEAQVHSGEDQEVWLAARIPTDRRKDVSVQIGSQTLVLAESPTAPYGDGFAWYRLGTTRLAGPTFRAKISVVGSGESDLAIDTLMLSPRPFRPAGVRMPDPIVFTVLGKSGK